MKRDERVALASLSSAMDGGFTAIHDVSAAIAESGAASEYRLIGGITVMLHVQRLGLALPIRATGDADFGVPRHVLRDSTLIATIESRGYRKVMGNRWERRLDATRVAAVDFLVPAYRSRARSTIQIGDVVSTEVPGLAEAFRRPGINLDAELRLTNHDVFVASVVLPDALGTLALKTRVRSVRNELRDIEDLWRCLEIAAADGVEPTDLDATSSLQELRSLLWSELGPDGRSLRALAEGLTGPAAAQRRTRVRALLAEVVGTP
ncbi:MAG TPA: hypothetical protein VFF40_08345 [Acidimicrobiia bacterium]|nr:hypothetical protein [Acidimicrobiia bacterium]